jgi:hypothetical protein
MSSKTTKQPKYVFVQAKRPKEKQPKYVYVLAPGEQQRRRERAMMGRAMRFSAAKQEKPALALTAHKRNTPPAILPRENLKFSKMTPADLVAKRRGIRKPTPAMEARARGVRAPTPGDNGFKFSK